MKRLPAALGLLGLLAFPLDAGAHAQFDPSVNGLRLPKGTLRTYDFEGATPPQGLELATWVKSGGFPELERTIANATQLAGLLTTTEDAIEGAHALRLGKGGTGLAIVDPALFAHVKDGRFEVSLWARADGTAPQLQVVYDRDPTNIYVGQSQFATVRGVRTGRETTDGWAEYSTGALDGSVWGAPVRAILVLPSYFAKDSDTFVIDALEVLDVEGKPTAPTACTQQTVDAICGAEGDCMFGHCVSSTVTWGVLPSPAFRSEIAERWILYGTRLIGDRNALKNGIEILTPNARTLAKTAASSRQFFGGMSRLVNLLRDNHTSFGSPSNFTSFAPQVQYGSSSALGACFGVVEKDLLGGGLGYAVFRANDNPLSKTPLKRGDVVFSIDGRDPKEWVDEVWATAATAFPNDPASDWGPSANDLSRLITTRARTVTLLRCASPSEPCVGDAQNTITVDVSSAIYGALTGEASSAATSPAFACTQRFSETVSTAAASQDPNGEDVVSVGPGSVSETRVQFDGFSGRNTWKSSMTRIFSARPERVLMDARMGHGGYYDTVQHLFELLRGTSEPAGVLSIGRGTYDLLDPPWLLSRLGTCADNGGDQWACFQGNANGFFATKADPPGGASRIAWLNTYDVSANDFMPRLLQGRSNVKIFSPHPTSGAFGSVSSLPSLWTGWSGGSMQVQDTRFGVDIAGITNVRWESGHGVAPDVVVAQKLSDAIAGVDTIVQAATAWLANP